MTGIEIIILIALVLLLLAGVGYYMTKDQSSLKQMKQDYQDNKEVQEMVELAKELYIKDLRPIAAKKSPKETKSEFPIEQSVSKKRKYYPKKKKTEDK